VTFVTGILAILQLGTFVTGTFVSETLASLQLVTLVTGILMILQLVTFVTHPFLMVAEEEMLMGERE